MYTALPNAGYVSALPFAAEFDWASQVPALALGGSRKEYATATDAPTRAAAVTSVSGQRTAPGAPQPDAMSAANAESAPGADGQQGQPPSNGDEPVVTAPNGSIAAKWLLFNDFAISAAKPSDVLRLYGAHKIPVLLYFRQVRLHNQIGRTSPSGLA